MIRLVFPLACLQLLFLLDPSLVHAQGLPIKIGTVLPSTGILSVQGTDTGTPLRTKRQGPRIANVAVDRIPTVSAEAIWTW